jgi:hypothetical protein
MIEMSGRSPCVHRFSGLIGVAAIALSLILTGCATSRPASPTPQSEAKPETKPEAKPEARPAPRPEAKPEPGPGGGQTGEASWYGEPHHGRTTASGEIYDMNQLTAAHRTCPGDAGARDQCRMGARWSADQRPRASVGDASSIYSPRRGLGAVPSGTIPLDPT